MITVEISYHDETHCRVILVCFTLKLHYKLLVLPSSCVKTRNAKFVKMKLENIFLIKHFSIT